MTINFEQALGLHAQALTFRERRSELLATNLANVDTPNYKARDMDFKAMLDQSLSPTKSMEKTQVGHLSPQREMMQTSVLYRNPQQPSLDGNTVEAHIEQAEYAENSLRYQASLRFINGKFAGLMTAIRGE